MIGLLALSIGWPTWDGFVQGLVWMTLALVAVGSLLSTRSAWVRSRPFGNYVAYSVFAHTILLAIAFGTSIHYEPRGYSEGYGLLSVPLSSIAFEDETEANEPSDEAERAPTEFLQVDNPVDDSDKPPVETPEPPPLMAQRSELASNNPALPVPELIHRSKPVADVVPESAADTLELPIGPEAADSLPPSEFTPKIAASDRVADSDTNDTQSQPVAIPNAAQPNVPSIYRNRSASERSWLAAQFGGGPDTEAAVSNALQWLAANQSADGRWDADAFGAGREVKLHGHDRRNAGAKADMGITALAVLAFLGANHTHLQGDYPDQVQYGLEFLLRSQRADGSLAGEAEFFASMYCHGMALLALSEAYVLTKDERLLPSIQLAVDYSVKAQHSSGGWRYQPGDPGDMSQFGWQVMGLKSAEAGGIVIPEKTRLGMRKFLYSASSGRHLGLAGYRPGERVSPTMTAEAIMCRIFLDDYRDAQGKEAAEFLRSDLPRQGQENLYYWYYGTMALFQIQGPEWEIWNAALKRQLLQQQRQTGELAGSWDPDRQWGQYGGRVFSTAFGALCLEVYYRYLPIYKLADSSAPLRALPLDSTKQKR